MTTNRKRQDQTSNPYHPYEHWLDAFNHQTPAEREAYWEYEHYLVVEHFQKELSAKLGKLVSYEEAEMVAYGWMGTIAERIDALRQRLRLEGTTS
jgi:hypothetical protein